LHQKPTTILPNTIRLSMRFSAHRYTSAGDTIQESCAAWPDGCTELRTMNKQPWTNDTGGPRRVCVIAGLLRGSDQQEPSLSQASGDFCLERAGSRRRVFLVGQIILRAEPSHHFSSSIEGNCPYGSPLFWGRPRGNFGEIGVANGTVKWFNQTRGYGFIRPDDGGSDVFVPVSVERAGYTGLAEGARISYELVPDRRGKPAAQNPHSRGGFWSPSR
jgi:cold shock protein